MTFNSPLLQICRNDLLKAISYSGVRTELVPDKFPIAYYSNKKEFIWGTALICTPTIQITSRLHLVPGLQHAFLVIEKGKNIGYGDFNYDPGFGALKSSFMLMAAPPLAIIATHSQAIVTLKYRL